MTLTRPARGGGAPGSTRFAAPEQHRIDERRMGIGMDMRAVVGHAEVDAVGDHLAQHVVSQLAASALTDAARGELARHRRPPAPVRALLKDPLHPFRLGCVDDQAFVGVAAIAERRAAHVPSLVHDRAFVDDRRGLAIAL